MNEEEQPQIIEQTDHGLVVDQYRQAVDRASEFILSEDKNQDLSFVEPEGEIILDSTEATYYPLVLALAAEKCREINDSRGIEDVEHVTREISNFITEAAPHEQQHLDAAIDEGVQYDMCVAFVERHGQVWPYPYVKPVDNELADYKVMRVIQAPTLLSGPDIQAIKDFYRMAGGVRNILINKIGVSPQLVRKMIGLK